MRCAAALRRRRTPLRAARRGQRIIELLPLEQRFGLARAPWHGRDSAKRDARVADHAVLKVERDGRRGQRELIGLAVARLQIERTRPAALDRRSRRSIPRAQGRLDLRAYPGRLVQLREWKVARTPDLPGDLDRGIERDQGLREIARIGRDALIAKCRAPHGCG